MLISGRAWLSVVMVAALTAAACSDAESTDATGAGASGVTTASGGGSAATGGAAGAVGSGGSANSGGVGGTGTGCPADAPEPYSMCDSDGLTCTYDAPPCPVALFCIVATPQANVFGWRPRPPEPGSACDMAGQVCKYEDCSSDSQMASYWTATCSAALTWDVTKASMGLCSM